MSGYTRGNRIRSTKALEIVPLPQSVQDYCSTDHRTAGGSLKTAGYAIHVCGYPFGLYCKKCADEIWKTWTGIIGLDETEGVSVKGKKQPAEKVKGRQKVAA